MGSMQVLKLLVLLTVASGGTAMQMANTQHHFLQPQSYPNQGGVVPGGIITTGDLGPGPITTNTLQISNALANGGAPLQQFLHPQAAPMTPSSVSRKQPGVTHNHFKTRRVNRQRGRVSFGEACNATVHCNARAYLTCSNGVCQCTKSDQMTFSPKAQRCVVLSGEQCRFTAPGAEEDDATQASVRAEQYGCVDNAKCSGDGFCTCNPDHFEDATRLCVHKRSYNEECSKSEDCRQGLTCADGTCACNATEAVFDPRLNQCVHRVGIPFQVTPHSNCVQNAFLEVFHPEIGGNHTRMGECKCIEGFPKSENGGLCMVKRGMACHPEIAPCGSEWACINGVCTCPFPDHQFQFGDKCVSLVRGPCSMAGENQTGSFACVPNAVCKNSRGFNECACKDGYIESTERRCRPTFGQPCMRLEKPRTSEYAPMTQPPVAVNIAYNHVYRHLTPDHLEIRNVNAHQRLVFQMPQQNTCDPIAKLVCKEGFCACHDFHVYDAATSTCKGLVGAKCEPGDQCIAGATCTKARDATNNYMYMESVCACDAHMTVTPERTCEGKPNVTLPIT